MSDVDKLKAKLAQWEQHLSGDDVHSIRLQLGRMLWRSAFYRAVNESRKFTPGPPDSKEANGALHELIDEGYFLVQALAVRRLLEKGSTDIKKGVYSLYALISDIKDHAALLTRQNVLVARNLTYDYEPARKRAFEEARADAKARRMPAYYVSREGWAEAEDWHRSMDRLCNVSPEKRDPCDAPDSRRFESLLGELADRARNIKDFVDKYVAHAATPHSRTFVPSENLKLSLAKLWLAERVIVRAATFVSLYLVRGTQMGGVPIPQFDQFEHLEKPFIQEPSRKAMQIAWDQHSDEMHACQEWFWDRPLVDNSDVWIDSDQIAE